MKRRIKTLARMNAGFVELLVLIHHPMETGFRTDKKTGRKVPAHFIQSVNIKLNNSDVIIADLGRAISTNPLLTFRLKEARNGDKLEITWSDNRGEDGRIETVLNF